MSAVNYDALERRLAEHAPYVHGSSHAEWAHDEYHVWSYWTLILVYDGVSGHVTYYNRAKYSRTTSKLQRLVERYFDTESLVRS